MKKKNMGMLKRQLIVGAVSASLIVLSSNVIANETLYAAMTEGTTSFDVRYRYEMVSTDDGKKDAAASTVRTRMAYEMSAYENLGAYLEFEDVSEVGAKKYGGDYSVVADPKVTEINQAYFSYDGLPGTQFRYGRQRIILDNARFVGNVGWRQNEQTFDAFSIKNTLLKDTVLDYAFLFNTNTITGGNDAMDTHLLNVSYSGLPIGTVTGYGYFLDYTNKTGDSQTLGVRLKSARGTSKKMKVIYTAEYAIQNEYADTAILDASYTMLEAGLKYSGVVMSLAQETLSGNGINAFQTPLATKHAFNGWADKFLATPATGVKDLMVKASGKVKGASLLAVYHQYTEEQGGAEMGSELDVLVARKVAKGISVGVKYADYTASSYSVDATKTWLWLAGKF